MVGGFFKAGMATLDRGFASLGSYGKKSREASKAWRNAPAMGPPYRAGGLSPSAVKARQASISTGRRRAMYGGGGLIALNLAQGARAPGGRSSGSGGLTPHSSGAETFL